MLFTIQPSANEPTPAGNYHATFKSMTQIETSKGQAHRWEFQTLDGGKIISDLSDANGPPTVRNKTGKWLCALANKPLAKDVQVDPTLFVGKKYFVIVEANGKINTFTAIA